ncbi:MAG: hypothetical protein IPN89_17790 [Saprospiraceae bacterium]|nr:hypothetical protein [Saprospiraceae bacterium]
MEEFGLPGVSKFSGNTWVTFTSSNSGLKSNRTRAVLPNVNGQIWAGTVDGLFILDGTTWTFNDLAQNNLLNNYVHDVYIDKNNIKWITQTGVLHQLNGGIWKSFPFPSGF